MLLRSLSDDAILSRVSNLVRRERGLTLRVLDHLIEIERRKLHLERGYSSMFVYCTQGLGYSESAAWRRIQCARCIARFSDVRATLASNDINLSTLACVARVLEFRNKDELLASIRGRSLAEVKAIVSRHEPRAMPRDVVRPVAVKRIAPMATVEALRLDTPSRNCAPAGAGAGAGAGGACEKSDYCRSGSNPPAERPVFVATTNPAGNAGPVDIESRTRLSFTVDAEFIAHLERIKSLAWHRLGGNPSLEQVFAMTMESFLEKNDPIRRKERRERREQRASARAAAVTG